MLFLRVLTDSYTVYYSYHSIPPTLTLIIQTFFSCFTDFGFRVFVTQGIAGAKCKATGFHEGLEFRV